jgi:hypothetical protein
MFRFSIAVLVLLALVASEAHGVIFLLLTDGPEKVSGPF